MISTTRRLLIPTRAQAATTVLIRKGCLDTVDDLVDQAPVPLVRRTLRSLDGSSALKRAIRSALLELGAGTSRELVAKALHVALMDHERKHPSPI